MHTSQALLFWPTCPMSPHLCKVGILSQSPMVAPPMGVSSCISLGWPAGWPNLYMAEGKNSGWHNTWFSEWCNLTPAMWCHAVNTGIMWPCYFATSFIGGGHRGHRSHVGRGPLTTPYNRLWCRRRRHGRVRLHGKGGWGRDGLGRKVGLPLQLGTLGPAVQEGMEKYKELSLGWGVKTLLFPL